VYRSKDEAPQRPFVASDLGRDVGIFRSEDARLFGLRIHGPHRYRAVVWRS
jgi:hypothetical protein